ncbi:MAG: D-alanyl-D-alanine carboxypeptidase [Clostridia bacterium]|nr:D-alanyl-D-alanine carboxypeptidase [Clostridia bacterium]
MKLNIKYLFIPFFILLILSIFFSTSFANNNLDIYSPSCILIDSNSGKILYEKNAYTKMYPASTTKIMTAILVLEKCNLNEIVTVSDNAVSLNSVPETYTRANIKSGEQLSIEDLLNVLLIPSANDAAIALAEHVSGTVDEFSKLMNSKAKEIGCTNTNFVNPNGVHNDNHYSTAYDMALIGKYAMNNETFRKIVSKTSCSLPTTNMYDKNDRKFNTTNELLTSDNFYYPYTTGIKTGYTNSAKNCIVASCKNEDYEFIVVVLGANKMSQVENDRAHDCITLFNYALENYKEKIVSNPETIIKQIELELSDNTKKTLNIMAEKEIKVTTASDISKITPQIVINENLHAPILKGTIVGNISYTIDNTTYTSNLISGNNILDSEMLPQIFSLLLFCLILLLFITILKIKRHKKDKDVFMKFYK